MLNFLINKYVCSNLPSPPPPKIVILRKENCYLIQWRLFSLILVRVGPVFTNISTKQALEFRPVQHSTHDIIFGLALPDSSSTFIVANQHCIGNFTQA